MYSLKTAQDRLHAGRPQEAEMILRHMLSADPNNADALHLMGILALQANQAQQAMVLFDKALALNDRNADFHANRAAALLSLGRYAQGEEALKFALQRKRNHVQANYNLGLLKLGQGQWDDAERYVARAVKGSPRHVDALNTWGIILRQKKRYLKAAQKFRQALKIAPNHQECLIHLPAVLAESGDLDGAMERFNALLDTHPQPLRIRLHMASALMKGGRPQEAEETYRTIVKMFPNHFEAFNNLGSIALVRGDYEEAIDCYAEALKRKPTEANIRSNLAYAYLKAGFLDGAEDLCREVITEHPLHDKAHFILYATLEQSGRFDEAQVLGEKFVAKEPHSPAALLIKAWMREGALSEGDIERLYGFAGDEGIENIMRRDMWFALGRNLHEAARWEEAFECYHSGNAFFDGLLTWTEDDDAKRVAAIVKTFTPLLFSILGSMGSQSARPIFIVGMPRSGTTLIEQILATHPDVAAAGELPDMGLISRQLDTSLESGYPLGMAAVSQKQVQEVVTSYLESLKACNASARHVTDKMPDNYWLLGLIAVLFPKAKVIHCRRDPRATGLSIYFQNFERSHPYATDLHKIGVRYRHYLTLMEHWRKVLPFDMFEVDYEAAVNNLEDESRRLLDFCELEWNDEVLEFHRTERTVKTASLWQVRQPLYKRALDYWRHYEQWLDPFVRGLNTMAK